MRAVSEVNVHLQIKYNILSYQGFKHKKKFWAIIYIVDVPIMRNFPAWHLNVFVLKKIKNKNFYFINAQRIDFKK